MPLQWGDLTLDEQIAVERKEVGEMLKALMEVGKPFLPEELHFNYTLAVEKAENMRTPWFTHEYIMDDPKLRDWVIQQTQYYIRHAIYLVSNEYCIDVPLVRKK